MKILVDGYNLVFHCGFNGPHSSPASIARSRLRLYDLLVNRLSVSLRKQTTVVFDAKKLPANEPSLDSRKHEMRVIFSAGYDSADTLIIELIRAHSHPKNLVVVSSDHQIQTAAKRRKASPIDCEDWLDQLSRQPRARRQVQEKDAFQQEVDFTSEQWIDLFSNDAPNHLQQEQPSEANRHGRRPSEPSEFDRQFLDEMLKDDDPQGLEEPPNRRI